MHAVLLTEHSLFSWGPYISSLIKKINKVKFFSEKEGAMVKKAILFLVSFLLVSSFAYADKKFTVSGVVYFQHDSDIYINLITRV